MSIIKQKGSLEVIDGTLRLTTLGTGTTITSLGIDSNGFVVSAGTDTNTFTTGATLNGTILEFDRNDLSNAYSVDLGSLNAVDIQYNQLYDDVVNGDLIQGQWYRLTDYRSVNFLNGWLIANNNPTPTDPNFDPREIYEGQTEVLFLQAISDSEISPIGYSEKFPQDIIQYEPFTNKIGVNLQIYNGVSLPNSLTVSGFDLQWDGTNAYFEMPTGYPALFGHYFYLYFSINSGGNVQEGVFEPLTPGNVTCQFPVSVITRIRVENGGTKIVLLNLTEQDVLDYDNNTLFVSTVYELGDCYGWITRRVDTHRNINVPFDFRGRQYRRFEVDLSAINPTIGTNFWGIGDDFLGQGTTGSVGDFKPFDNEGTTYDIKWDGLGGPDVVYFRGFNDNLVVLGNFVNNNLGVVSLQSTLNDGFVYNTLGGYFFNNVVGNNFTDNKIGFGFNNNIISNDFINNTILNYFQDNNISNSFGSNTIGGYFFNNVVGSQFTYNHVGGDFSENTVGNNFIDNTVGDFFLFNTVADLFQRNGVSNGFVDNTVGDSFEKNIVNNDFLKNTVGNNFQNNTVGNNFQNNTVGNNFQINQIDYSPTSTNFTSATHVYGDYNCRIFKSNDTNLYLEYFSGTTATYVSPTS
jgi:hypothetical protein